MTIYIRIIVMSQHVFTCLGAGPLAEIDPGETDAIRYGEKRCRYDAVEQINYKKIAEAVGISDRIIVAIVI